jgi:hypothetical protein
LQKNHESTKEHNSKSKKLKFVMVFVPRCQLLPGGKKRKRYIFHSPPKGGGLLRLSAFSATLTGRFGMGTVRMGAEGRW